ncbi:response regulator [Massilia alkalitolerans]|uniref:response regulator n=1 Tax=Massilia alkalitolerans TaxID=286638 RepID=UPI0028AC1227|nr:response regulator [Massilia alkalitolerans]
MDTMPPAQLRVLLVERNEGVCELLTSLLERMGFIAEAVKTGAEAMAAARARPPHAVYSSLMLGDMHGFDLCRMLRSMPELEHTVFVALTGYSETNVVQESKDAGFAYCLLKPVSLGAILAPLHSIPGLEEDGALHDAYRAFNKALLDAERQLSNQ